MNSTFFMREAINEALKADPNQVYPNPLVGCVIVKDNKIISRGYHKKFGENHAEVNAIKSIKKPIDNVIINNNIRYMFFLINSDI